MSDTKPVLCDVPRCTRKAKTIVEFTATNGKLIRLLCNSHARVLVVASGYTQRGAAA